MAISSNAKMVPIMATIAIAVTSSFSFSLSRFGETLMEPETPMTAAAPQMPVPQETSMAMSGSTPIQRQIQ